jgi:ATP-binding cassette subfamily B multidrug efflux pump
MKSRGTLWRFTVFYAWPHRWAFAAGAVCLLATNWLTVTIPIVLGEGIDALTAGGGVEQAAVQIALMGLAVVVVRTLSRVLFFNPGRDMEYRLRRDLFAHLLRLQPSFYARNRTGDIVSRASNDITWTRAMVGFGLMQVVNTTVALSMTGWRMVGISLELTLAALVPIVLALGVVQLMLGKLFVLQKRSQVQLGEISDHVLGSFQGIATVQGFSAEDAFSKRLHSANLAWFDTSMRLAMIRSLAFPLLGLAGGSGIFMLLYYGGPQAVEGDLSVGDLAAFATLIAALLPPLRSLGWMLSVLQRGRAALTRIYEILDAKVDCPEGPDPVAQTPGAGPAIRIQDLSFAYPDREDELVLDALSLEIAAGSVVGVVGKTGSGKTSLLRVLSRLYDPPAGSISVDGADIVSLDRGDWRGRVAMAPQRPFLFSDTIAENIALGTEPAEGSVREAAGRAALGPDLKVLPDGLETVVGQRGIMLSGGQRQRVALARALMRGADLVLLDDVLSAVDHKTEHALVSALRGEGSERRARPTVVIVSNRVSAVRHADSIVVIEDGRVVDQGTHGDLKARAGYYQDICRVQDA